MKTDDDHFRDWETDAFGYGYGTGEPAIIPALRKIIELCPAEGCYDYKVFEDSLGPAVTWLLINRLCRKDIFDYGSSPRCGWLSTRGKRLKAYMTAQSSDELVEIVTDFSPEYVPCGPNYCNCGPEGVEGKQCENPFWLERLDLNQVSAQSAQEGLATD